MTEETFDLREVLAGIERATGETTIYFNEKLSNELAKTNKQLTRLSTRVAGGDEKAAEDFNKLDDAFEKMRDKLRKQGYIVRYRGIPKRMKEDLQSKALHEYPYIRDAYGRDDEQRSFDRQRFLRTRIFAAYVTEIESPTGGIQRLHNDDDAIAVMDAFCGQAPDGEIDKLDREIGELSDEADTKALAQQETDFLS